MRLILPVLTAAAFFFPLSTGAASANVGDQLFKLLASDGEEDDIFALSVAISGDIAVMGAPDDDDNALNSGAAYVYRWTGSYWEEVQKLIASDGGLIDNFGESVAVSDDLIVIGAPGDYDNGPGSGSAYVFRYNGYYWAEEVKLLPSDGAMDDNFGDQIAVSGDVVVVAAPHDDDYGSNSGSAYVFSRNGSIWSQTQKLVANDGASGDVFGHSVSVSGTVAIIGASNDDDNGSATGSAYVFRQNGGSWLQEAKLLASDGEGGDYFGYSVSVSGDTAVVGAPWDNGNATESGTAYVYRWSGAYWQEEAKLQSSDGNADDHFGASVAVSGDVAVVGAWADDDNGSLSGSASVYHKVGNGWSEQAKLLASDGYNSDRFGYAVAVSENRAIIGSAYDDDNDWDSGSAYIFDAGSPTPTCEGDVDGNGLVGMGDLIILLAAWGPCGEECSGADLDQNGIVGFSDLLIMLGAWGPCPE